MYDYLIVGAGFSGAVMAERIASQLDKKVLLIDRRNHIGGNAYDYIDEHGILVHKYGPHIFHTNAKKVWEYLSRFTQWHKYEHRVRAEVNGKLVPIPFNLTSIDMMFDDVFSPLVKERLINTYGMEAKVPILKLRESQDSDLKRLADFIYEKIFYGYNLKQWELKPDELDPSVTARVPVFISRDDRYFQDTYQGIPKLGYTELFKNIISHKNITIKLSTSYESMKATDISFTKVIYTGPIDSYFNFKHGELPYRSLRFEFENVSIELFQETGQINFPNNFRYTRITEFKHLTGQQSDNTTIVREYPERHILDKNEPYYPIPTRDNSMLFDKYRKEADLLKNVFFVGRLADYKYYNMDQTVARALVLFENEIT